MNLEEADRLEQAELLLLGMKNLCQLLEIPCIPPITSEGLIVFECVLDRIRELISEVIEIEIRIMNEETGGKE